MTKTDRQIVAEAIREAWDNPHNTIVSTREMGIHDTKTVCLKCGEGWNSEYSPGNCPICGEFSSAIYVAR